MNLKPKPPMSGPCLGAIKALDDLIVRCGRAARRFLAAGGGPYTGAPA